jgi:hypothetical protein
VVDILTRPMSWPRNPQETQTLLADSREEVHEKLGGSGTIIYLPECDRFSYKKVQTLAEHAIKEMGRVYRRFIDRGLKLYVNNRLVEAFDPTYWMQSARHVHVEGLTETRSRLVGSWAIDVPVADGASETTRVRAKLFALPYEAWSGLPRKVLKNDLHVYGDFTVSFMRNDREVDIAATVPKLKLRKHHTNNWLRLEIDFTGEADEGFGVAANKQGVRLKEYVAEKILEVIGEHLAELRKAIMEQKARHASLKSASKVSAAERRATDAEPLQGKPLPPEPETPEQQAALEQNLRADRRGLKRCGIPPTGRRHPAHLDRLRPAHADTLPPVHSVAYGHYRVKHKPSRSPRDKGLAVLGRTARREHRPPMPDDRPDAGQPWHPFAVAERPGRLQTRAGT